MHAQRLFPPGGSPGASAAPAPDSEDTCDRLAGDWQIWQLRRGHRFSADDMLTAWLAADVAPAAVDLLDLGAGIGSVGLMTLWRMGPAARLLMVEAQEVSHGLARKTVETNDLAGRVSLRLGDLRDPTIVTEAGRFDLVTGSPPYIPLGKGVVSPVAQRAACRMELRGSIIDYAQTAARAMSADGWFVSCFAAADPRGDAAYAAAGLHLHVRQEVVFRAGQAPMITLFAGRHEPGPLDRREPLRIRDAAGVWTDAYLDLRELMGTIVKRPFGGDKVST
ncbi:MAG: methyltransferase [Pseudomonadota bacterium]|nr:methyltransferase [Pseudomonadota bacterium]